MATTYTDLREHWRDARESAEAHCAADVTHDLREALERVARVDRERAAAAHRAVGTSWRIAGPFPPLPPKPIERPPDRRRRPSRGYVPTSGDLVAMRRRLGLSQWRAAELVSLNRAVLSQLELDTRKAPATRAELWRVYLARVRQVEGAA